jgi:hypothetical protein
MEVTMRKYLRALSDNDASVILLTLRALRDANPQLDDPCAVSNLVCGLGMRGLYRAGYWMQDMDSESAVGVTWNL